MLMAAGPDASAALTGAASAVPVRSSAQEKESTGTPVEDRASSCIRLCVEALPTTRSTCDEASGEATPASTGAGYSPGQRGAQGRGPGEVGAFVAEPGFDDGVEVFRCFRIAQSHDVSFGQCGDDSGQPVGIAANRLEIDDPGGQGRECGRDGFWRNPALG